MSGNKPSRAKYMREWRIKREQFRRVQIVAATVGLYLSPPSSLALWYRPGTTLSAEPVVAGSNCHIGQFAGGLNA